MTLDADSMSRASRCAEASCAAIGCVRGCGGSGISTVVSSGRVRPAIGWKSGAVKPMRTVC